MTLTALAVIYRRRFNLSTGSGLKAIFAMVEPELSFCYTGDDILSS